MAKETLEIRQICHNSPKDVFSFEYDFYEEVAKNNFEQKFIDYYYFDEINFESIERFKHRLKTRLNLIAPYYKQLYATELEARKCNFMLNKDLKETFLREIDNSSIVNSIIVNENTSNVDNESLSFNSITPQGTIADIEQYMTDANKAKDNNTIVANENSNANSNNTSSGTEKTELISQGNIGITSSGSLLKDWREVLINIDEMIIEECKDLFLMVY